MARVGRGPDAGSEQHDPRLLGGHGDPAGAALSAREVALAVGAEAAEVAERHVERAVPREQAPVPVPERRRGRARRRPGRLVPGPRTDAADPDAQIADPAER